MEREDLPGECLMEYDFRFMTLAEDVGCMILNPPFQKQRSPPHREALQRF